MSRGREREREREGGEMGDRWIDGWMVVVKVMVGRM